MERSQDWYWIGLFKSNNEWTWPDGSTDYIVEFPDLTGDADCGEINAEDLTVGAFECTNGDSNYPLCELICPSGGCGACSSDQLLTCA